MMTVSFIPFAQERLVSRLEGLKWLWRATGVVLVLTIGVLQVRFEFLPLGPWRHNTRLLPKVPRSHFSNSPSFASQILERSGIMTLDTDTDLSWHALLGHSIEMQGWRAAELVSVGAITKDAPGLVPHRTGYRCSGVGRSLGDPSNS